MAFLMYSGTNVLTGPAVGYFCDHMRHPVLISMSGNVVMALAFLQSSVGQTYGAMATVGLGYAVIMATSFARAHRNAVHTKGFPDGVRTGVVVVGLWNGAFYLGNFVRPTASGFIIEAIGFKWTTMVFVGAYAAEFCFSRRMARALYERL